MLLIIWILSDACPLCPYSPLLRFKSESKCPSLVQVQSPNADGKKTVPSLLIVLLEEPILPPPFLPSSFLTRLENAIVCVCVFEFEFDTRSLFTSVQIIAIIVTKCGLGYARLARTKRDKIGRTIHGTGNTPRTYFRKRLGVKLWSPRFREKSLKRHKEKDTIKRKVKDIDTRRHHGGWVDR